MSALTPVRLLFQPFLTDADAVRVLRVSRTVARSLLPSYTFHSHPFECGSVEGIRRLKALCETYQLRPTRMCLSKAMKALTWEEGSGESPFPSSLTSLLLGPLPRAEEDEDISSDGIPPHCIFGSEGRARVESINCLWTHPKSDSQDEHYRQLLMENTLSPVLGLEETKGLSRCSLTPGLLPHGLRHLQLPSSFDSPLQVGSIPSTVEVLQFGRRFSKPLLRDVLSSSLVHLVLHSYNKALEPHVLPPTLQRLCMWMWNQPLTTRHVLPDSLKALRLMNFNQPIALLALPRGLTHLSFRELQKPLTEGCLPPSLVALSLGAMYRSPLLPQQLPPSLRVFFHSQTARHPLKPGDLPEGLVVLHWHLGWQVERVRHPLIPGVLPSSLRVLDLGPDWACEIQSGAIPGGVKWVRLPARIREMAEPQIPPGAQVVWQE